MSADVISKLVKNQVQGFTLDQIFYQDPDIYQRELDRLFLKSWLYTGPVSQSPNIGDYFL